MHHYIHLNITEGCGVHSTHPCLVKPFRFRSIWYNGAKEDPLRVEGPKKNQWLGENCVS